MAVPCYSRCVPCYTRDRIAIGNSRNGSFCPGRTTPDSMGLEHGTLLVTGAVESVAIDLRQSRYENECCVSGEGSEEVK
jgi:hypothetical protein